MLVQIYEVQTPAEAVALAALGVDHIGVLVGDGAFPRELPAARVAAIFAALPPGAKRVALSLSADRAEIARVIKQTRPDIIHIGAAVELFSVGDTQAIKTAFPDVRIMRAIPMVDEANVKCAKDYRGVADFLLLDSHDPGDRQMAPAAACTTGASADALSARRECPPFLPAGWTPTMSPRLLPPCGRQASIRRPRPTGPTAAAKISTRRGGSSPPRNSPGQRSSPQLNGPIVLYHAQQLPSALRSERAAETPVIIRLRGKLRIENDRLAAVCRARQWRPRLLCHCGKCDKYRHEGGSEGAVLHCASERFQHRLGTGDVEYTRFFDVQRLDDAVIDQHRVALRAHPHAFLHTVELEPDGAGEFAAAVAQHHDVAVATVLLAPGAHDKGVVDRDAGDRVDPLGLDLGGLRDVARQMTLRARPRIGARDREQRDLFPGKEFVGADGFDAFRGQIAQRHRRDLVSYLDRHWFSSVQSMRNTALPGICRSRSRGPIWAMSRQLASTSCGFNDPSATSETSNARSSAKRSSASDVK